MCTLAVIYALYITTLILKDTSNIALALLLQSLPSLPITRERDELSPHFLMFHTLHILYGHFLTENYILKVDCFISLELPMHSLRTEAS